MGDLDINRLRVPCRLEKGLAVDRVARYLDESVIGRVGVVDEARVDRDQKADRQSRRRDQGAVFARKVDRAAVEKGAPACDILTIGLERILLSLHNLHEIEARENEERK